MKKIIATCLFLVSVTPAFADMTCYYPKDCNLYEIQGRSASVDVPSVTIRDDGKIDISLWCKSGALKGAQISKTVDQPSDGQLHLLRSKDAKTPTKDDLHCILGEVKQ